MYSKLIYTGQIRPLERIAAIRGALGVLWAAICGWAVSGIDYPDDGNTSPIE